MSSPLPSVDVTVRTNSLGLQDPSQGDALAVIGPAPSSTIAVNTPLLYGRVASLLADHVDGPLTEAAALGLDVTGRPVVVVRTATTTAGAISDVDDDAVTGTCEITATSGAEPKDDTEPYVEVVTGGTIGTTGITYRSSFDGGRTMSPTTALGTALVCNIGAGTSFDLNPNEADFVAFVVNLRTKALAHFIYTTGSVHLAADTTSDDAVSAAPTNWATGIDVLNDLRAAALLHATNNTAHTADDTVSFASLPAVATTKHEAVTLAIAMDTAFAAHLATTGSVHGAADATNVLTVAAPTHGTLVAGDYWTARTTAPKWTDAELDAALEALQRSSYTYKTVLLCGPLTNANTASIKTRWTAMFNAYKYKKLFGHFRMPNVGETESAYLAAYKAAFDTITDFYGISVSAGSFECQSSATKPRRYRRPPAWMAAAMHVALGPAESLAAVRDGAGAWQFGATIKDVNGNPKHHDESLDPGLDAARALTLRSLEGYPGSCFVTRARTLATLGTDFMWIHYWAAMVEVLDVAIPKLIGQIQAKLAPDPETGRVLGETANDVEGLVMHEIETKVIAKGVIVSARVQIDRTVNVFTTPKLPVTITAIPFFYPDGFSVTAALENPALAIA